MEWIEQLEILNQQLATIAHIKKLAEDEMMRIHEMWQEYQRNHEGLTSLYWIKGSSVESYEPGKWFVWVYTDMFPIPFGFIDKDLFLVEFTHDGWIVNECPAICQSHPHRMTKNPPHSLQTT